MTEKSFCDERLKLLEDNLKKVRDEVSEAAVQSGREPGDVKLMAVSKTVAPELINHAIACGVDLIGENKVQEVLEKRDSLELSNCKIHLIGHLQSNKVKKIVGLVDMIESVDSFELASLISKRSEAQGVVTDILMEVNIGSDENKFGFTPACAEEEMRKIAELEGVRLRGMMTVPPNFGDSVKNRRIFSDMRQLFIDIKAKKIDNVCMDILSMGMSGDFREAVAEGSTLVRVGSAIFGARKY